MKLFKPILLSFLIISPFMSVFAQYNALQINLEKHSVVIGKSQRVSVFCDFDGKHYYVGRKGSPKLEYSNPETWIKRDADCLKEITKKEFDSMAEMVLGLSSMNLVFGLNLVEYEITHDPDCVLLELSISGQRIVYELFLPFDPTNSHLKQFESICEQILLLADEDPDEFLNRQSKKWYQELQLKK